MARNIDTLDFSSVPDVNTSVSQDYNTYLEESGIFDDRDVISAFDDQIDVRADDLANQMSTSFSSYLDNAKGYIEQTNKVINTSRDNLKDLINDFPNIQQNKWEVIPTSVEFHCPPELFSGGFLLYFSSSRGITHMV